MDGFETKQNWEYIFLTCAKVNVAEAIVNLIEKAENMFQKKYFV